MIQNSHILQISNERQLQKNTNKEANCNTLSSHRKIRGQEHYTMISDSVTMTKAEMMETDP